MLVFVAIKLLCRISRKTIYFYRSEALLWTCLTLSHKFTHSLTIVFSFLISFKVKVIELSLCIRIYFYVKFVYVICVLSQSHTKPDSHGWCNPFFFIILAYNRNLYTENLKKNEWIFIFAIFTLIVSGCNNPLLYWGGGGGKLGHVSVLT